MRVLLAVLWLTVVIAIAIAAVYLFILPRVSQLCARRILIRF